jgi:recombination protein RecR
MLYTKSLGRLVSLFQKMPGIGQKSAQRLALYVLQISKPEAEKLARAILELKDKIRYCSKCHNITEVDPCSICADPERDATLICVVENPKDLLAIEKTKSYKGHYHVLMGTLSPLDNIGPDEIRIKELLNRVKRGGIKEIIIATSPNIEGETTAMYVSKLIKPAGIKVSRIACGLPMGGDLEYADEVTISKALGGRLEI